jgi:hypothetical protein
MLDLNMAFSPWPSVLTSHYSPTPLLANAILRLAADGRILLSFKPPGFFTSTKYEQLRVAEADQALESTDDNSQDEIAHGLDAKLNADANANANAKRGVPRDRRGKTADHDDAEEHGSEGEEGSSDEEDDDDEPSGGSKFKVNTRVGGFFGLLQEGEEEEEDEEDE